MSVTKKTMMKIQNSHSAIISAPAEICPKPNTPATMAIRKKINAQYNIFSSFTYFTIDKIRAL